MPGIQDPRIPHIMQACLFWEKNIFNVRQDKGRRYLVLLIVVLKVFVDHQLARVVGVKGREGGRAELTTVLESTSGGVSASVLQPMPAQLRAGWWYWWAQSTWEKLEACWGTAP